MENILIMCRYVENLEGYDYKQIVNGTAHASLPVMILYGGLNKYTPDANCHT